MAINNGFYRINEVPRTNNLILPPGPGPRPGPGPGPKPGPGPGPGPKPGPGPGPGPKPGPGPGPGPKPGPSPWPYTLGPLFPLGRPLPKNRRCNVIDCNRRFH